jgi:hypothetical protein
VTGHVLHSALMPPWRDVQVFLSTANERRVPGFCLKLHKLKDSQEVTAHDFYCRCYNTWDNFTVGIGSTGGTPGSSTGSSTTPSWVSDRIIRAGKQSLGDVGTACPGKTGRRWRQRYSIPVRSDLKVAEWRITPGAKAEADLCRCHIDVGN